MSWKDIPAEAPQPAAMVATVAVGAIVVKERTDLRLRVVSLTPDGTTAFLEGVDDPTVRAVLAVNRLLAAE